MSRRSLTFVVIGGGLVGVELLGELTAFADDVLRYYPRLRRDELRFHLFEAGARMLPEIDPALGAVATRVLQRRGADISRNKCQPIPEEHVVGARIWP